MTDEATEDLDALSTEDLRKRAFHRAERHGDVGFFWDLIRHLPSAADFEGDDGSLGGVTGGVAELVELFRELRGKDVGEVEPLLRARYLDYLRTSDTTGNS